MVEDKEAGNPGAPKTLKGSKEMPVGCWETGKQVEKCGLAEETKPIIILPVFVSQAITALCQKFPRHEWLAYLQGRTLGDRYIVTAIEVPEQEVSSTSVEVLKPIAALGTIHSHHTMGAFHSSTDETRCGGNHEVTIVVTNNGEYAAKCRKSLPCGATVLVDADISIERPIVKGIDKFVDEATPKVKQKVYTYTPVYSGGFFCGKCHKLVEVSQRVWMDSVCFHLECVAKKINDEGTTGEVADLDCPPYNIP